MAPVDLPLYVVDEWGAGDALREWTAIAPGHVAATWETPEGRAAFPACGGAALARGLAVVHQRVFGGALDDLHQHCDGHPDLVCIVISGGTPHASAPHPRCYVRHAEVGNPQDRDFSWRLQRFYDRLLRGVLAFDDLEPDPRPPSLGLAHLFLSGAHAAHGRGDAPGTAAYLARLPQSQWDAARAEYERYAMSGHGREGGWPAALLADGDVTPAVIEEVRAVLARAESGLWRLDGEEGRGIGNG